MTTYGRLEARTLTAAADLRTFQNRFVRQSAAGYCNVSSNNSLPTDIVGVLINKPDSGQAASIAFWGEARVQAGAAVTAGKMVTTDSSGQAINAVSGQAAYQMLAGQAQETTTTAGEYLRVLLAIPSFQATSGAAV